MAKKPVLVLIDGHALAYRAYFGMQTNLTTKTGEPTHAIYGFMNMLLAVWKECEPDYFIVTFDLGDTFRHAQYKEYKATREKMPDDLSQQIERITQLVRAFNMPIFTKENYEADDLLGTLARQAAEQGIEALIVTGDRDAFQLVGPDIKVIISGRSFAERETYDEARLQERYGLTPAQLIELKGLVGDTSDNIPGVRGIGEKGGIKLIQQYGTLEEIYAHLDDLTPSLRAKLEEGRESAFLSRDLGRIVTDVPGVELNLEAGRTTDFDMVEVAKLFVELDFNTIFNRIPGAPPDKSPREVAEAGGFEPAPAEEPAEGVYTTVDTSAGLAELVAALKQSPRLAVDVETDSTDEVQTNLVGIAISPRAGEGYYIPLGHGRKPPQSGEQGSLFDLAESDTPPPPQLPLAEVQAALAPILADPAILKVMHNAKFDMTVLQRHGLPVEPPLFDTMIAAWLVHNAPGVRYGLKELARERLNVQMTEIKELIGSGKSQITMAQVPVADCTPYAAADVDMTLRLLAQLDRELQAGDGWAWRLFQELELPLISVLKDMELAGIRLDADVLRQMGDLMANRLAELELEIYKVAGHEFNINSTQQLSDVLFKELGLPTAGQKKTKSGHYSTAAGVLEELAGLHDIIDLILEQRALTKLKSTYVDALPALVNPHTGRVHTNYTQVGISTGRLSSSEPNLQNIPIRTALGREIRRAFVAEPGWRLIAADYSQLELRILAHVTEDPNLLQAFADDEDVHSITAAVVLGIPAGEVTKDQRRVAKTVNYGVAYGQSAFGLAQSAGISQEEARAFITAYFEKYPGIKRYIDETKQMALDIGYVATMRGRRRWFPGMAKLPGPQRGAAERESINMPIQGTAADIMKQAMIDLDQALKSRDLRGRMLLQVHDELVLEAPEDEVDQVVALTREIMCHAADLKAPLEVDVEVGENWLEMEKVN